MFSAAEYEIYEDLSQLCINLNLYKGAYFDTTVQVIEVTENATAIGK